MKKIEDLKEGDYIGFVWNYGSFAPEIIVDNISSVSESHGFLVHFLYGYKSESEWVKPEDVVLIGDKNADTEIKGWSGKYFVLKNVKELELK